MTVIGLLTNWGRTDFHRCCEFVTSLRQLVLPKKGELSKDIICPVRTSLKMSTSDVTHTN